MLQETAEDRARRDVVGQPRHAGADRAEGAHHQLDFDAGLGCAIQRVNRVFVDQVVGLELDVRGTPGSGVLDLALE